MLQPAEIWLDQCVVNDRRYVGKIPTDRGSSRFCDEERQRL